MRTPKYVQGLRLPSGPCSTPPFLSAAQSPKQRTQSLTAVGSRWFPEQVKEAKAGPQGVVRTQRPARFMRWGKILPDKPEFVADSILFLTHSLKLQSKVSGFTGKSARLGRILASNLGFLHKQKMGRRWRKWELRQVSERLCIDCEVRDAYDVSLSSPRVPLPPGP